MGVRITRGTRTWSLYIQRNLATWLTNWSAASVMKSPNMISTTGRRPRNAIPAAIPTIAASETGVVNTRPGKSVDSPRVTLKAPPYGSRMSSPRIKTFSSKARARCRAALRESRTVGMGREGIKEIGWRWGLEVRQKNQLWGEDRRGLVGRLGRLRHRLPPGFSHAKGARDG